jgi:hypothetical protein
VARVVNYCFFACATDAKLFLSVSCMLQKLPSSRSSFSRVLLLTCPRPRVPGNQRFGATVTHAICVFIQKRKIVEAVVLRSTRVMKVSARLACRF